MASIQYNSLKKRWEQGRITEPTLRKYVQAKRITPEEFKDITGLDY